MPCTSKLADLKFKPKGSFMRCSGKRISDANYRDHPLRISILCVRRQCTSRGPRYLHSRCPYPWYLLWATGRFFFMSILIHTNSRGIQEICWNHKGQVAKCDHREYGLAEVQISRFGESGNSVDALFEGLGDQMQVHVFVLSVVSPADF